MCITANVISTFLLAMLLVPKLKNTAGGSNAKLVYTFVTSDSQFFVQFSG